MRTKSTKIKPGAAKANPAPGYGGLVPPLRREIYSQFEPYPFREKYFDISNSIVKETVKYGRDININVACCNTPCERASSVFGCRV